MGASSSLFAAETFNDPTTHFTIPVPRVIYDTVTQWEEQTHARERTPDLLLRKYVDFLDRRDQIGEIVDKGGREPLSYFSVIFQTCMMLLLQRQHEPPPPPPEFQQVYALDVDTTTEAGSFDPIENADAWISFMQRPRYDNVQRHYLAFATRFERAIKKQKDTFFVVLTTLFDRARPDRTHATVTMVHLIFDANARCSVDIVILDPHGVARTKKMISHEHAWMQFLRDVEEENHMTFVAKTVSKPYTHGGLQGEDPICVQWALVLGLTYVMNTPFTRKRKRGSDDDNARRFPPIPNEHLFAVMDVMALRRERIINAFMFWIHLVSGPLFLFIDARALYINNGYTATFIFKQHTPPAQLLDTLKNFSSTRPSSTPPATPASTAAAAAMAAMMTAAADKNRETM